MIFFESAFQQRDGLTDRGDWFMLYSLYIRKLSFLVGVIVVISLYQKVGFLFLFFKKRVPQILLLGHPL
ncbi:hypothetical protein JOC37_002185 [Desulfohalotomaculum tongense]|nr:hypothetical protein [Desulforadius tongensis]